MNYITTSLELWFIYGGIMPICLDFRFVIWYIEYIVSEKHMIFQDNIPRQYSKRME